MMKSVTSKSSTLRRAKASACLRASQESIDRLKSNDLPKKDVLPVARAAGTAAAKRTSELIPYCHPIPIDAIEIEFDVHDDHIWITASVEAVWKTGVEMEALTAASVAALTIYDMLKPVESDLAIETIRLVEKHGGKKEFRKSVPKDFRAAVIVTSDGTFEGRREDRSGKMICERLGAFGVTPSYEVLPDDRDQIIEALRVLVREGVDLVLTTGGTGLGPRDVTVEATRAVVEQEVPGIVEAARSYGQSRTPYAMLSRAIAGVCGKTLIINFPGSLKGVEETFNALFPGVFHAYGMIQGRGHWST